MSSYGIFRMPTVHVEPFAGIFTGDSPFGSASGEALMMIRPLFAPMALSASDLPTKQRLLSPTMRPRGRSGRSAPGTSYASSPPCVVVSAVSVVSLKFLIAIEPSSLGSFADQGATPRSPESDPRIPRTGGQRFRSRGSTHNAWFRHGKTPVVGSADQTSPRSSLLLLSPLDLAAGDRQRQLGGKSGGRNRAWERCRLIHPLGAPWPPRSIQDKLLIAISESRKSRRNSLRYPLNAG
jgi:hypothetical protein